MKYYSNPQDAKNNQLQALGESEKNERNELELVYLAMTQEPNKSFTCHDINNILKSGTNIASRIFRKLEVNNLISATEDVIAIETNKRVSAFKVINPDRKFIINITELPKVEKDVKILAKKYLAQISVFLLDIELEIEDRKRVLAMLLICTDKIAKGKESEMTTNLFLDGFKQDTCIRILAYIHMFLKNKGKIS